MKQQKTFNIDIAQFGDMIKTSYEHSSAMMKVINMFKIKGTDEYSKALNEATKDFSSFRVDKICGEEYFERLTEKLGSSQAALESIVNEIDGYRKSLGENIVSLYNKSDKELNEIEQKTGIKNNLRLLRELDDVDALVNVLEANKREFDAILFEMNSKVVRPSKRKDVAFSFKINKPELISSVDGSCSMLNADEPEALQL